jgi:hypothetical protein
VHVQATPHFSASDPRFEYARRLQQYQTQVARYTRLDQSISNVRLVTFLFGVALAWFVVRPGLLSGWWLLLPVVVFFVLVVRHDRVRRLLRFAERGVIFYQRGIARVEDHWAGHGEPGSEFLDHEHPYAQDLDLFGPGSLFELLCTARTQAGKQILAQWLCTAATPDEIRARQAAVEELRPTLDLREEFALHGDDVRAGVDSETLAAWASAPPQLDSPFLRPIAAGLATLAVATFVGWMTMGFPPLVLLAALGVEGVFAASLRTRVQHVLQGVAQAGRDLALLSEILATLERQRFTCPRLVTLRAALDTNGTPPSRQIARLRRLINLLESRNNQFFAPIAALLLWATQVALAIEAWRRVSGPAIVRWLAAVGEFEALAALAGYAYEHPRDPFPEIVQEGPGLAGVGLGHPLIPESRCVRNDVSLGTSPRVLIVSGSNMSGKSTLLRTVGTNVVLALAGAPVRAQRLRLSPLVVGATLRIQDSLQLGSSRFYAEITRIRLLMDLAIGPLPLLFLLDEILHGTNSHDRRIGAAAILRGLVERGALGLVTTHDLALVHLADEPALHATNVCFEDHFEDGRLVFDYRMRPGVVQKSNALALMRSIGLDV